jgi:hypothetical protein
MSKADPSRDRSSALRRSRVARQGLVLGAVAGSMGIAGALGLSAAVNQAASTPSGTTTYTPQGNTGSGTGLAHAGNIQRGDDGGEHESDDGGAWAPTLPSQQFGTGGQSGNGQSSGGASVGQAGHGGATTPHATTGGSAVAP